MRIGSFIICFFLANGLLGQSFKFVQKAKEVLQAKDTTWFIEEQGATGDEYDILSSGSENLEKLFLGNLKKSSRNHPDDLVQSHTLTTLAALATEAWKGSHYSDAKKWKKLGKYFRRASIRSTSRFSIMKQVSFRISLVDNHGKKFYYDRLGSGGGLNLYTGKKPKTKQEREEAEEIPLTFFTEEELVEKFITQIRRKHLFSDLKRGYYACAGVSVEIDERTLYKNRIPTARVVVVLGARRLRNVKVRKKPEQ